MKKMVSFISALAMCAVMAVPLVSSAEESPPESATGNIITQATEKKTSDVTITTVIKSSYKVIIPVGDEDISKEKKVELEVSASDVMIDDGQTLGISVKSNNNWKLVDETSENNILSYTLTPAGGSAITKQEDTVLTVAAGEYSDSTATKKMTAELTDTVKKSGKYKDKLTFEVKVTPTPPASPDPDPPEQPTEPPAPPVDNGEND